MILDAAVASILINGATMLAPPATARANTAAMAVDHRQAMHEAMLMSPMPVLATMMRQQVRQRRCASGTRIPHLRELTRSCMSSVSVVCQIQQTAAAAAQGAHSLLELAVNDGEGGAVDVAPMDMEMEDGSIGSTAMIGAAAAAMALMNLRGQH